MWRAIALVMATVAVGCGGTREQSCTRNSYFCFENRLEWCADAGPVVVENCATMLPPQYCKECPALQGGPACIPVGEDPCPW